MIQTWILQSPPNTIYHRIDSLENKEMIIDGVENAIQLISSYLSARNWFHLIIDLRSLQDEKVHYCFENHQLWSREFKAAPIITKHVRKTAMIGPQNEKYQTEKALLDSERLHFFFSKEDALKWLAE